MSYYAIHVRTGWELSIVDNIQKKAEQLSFKEIDSVIAPVLEIKKFVGQDVIISKKKMLASAYLFIKVKEYSAAVYHFIKEIAGVINILPHDVPQEEVEHFCMNYDLAIEEAEIEIHVVNEETAHIEEDENTILHLANTTDSIEEANELLEKLSTQEKTSLYSKIKGLIAKGKEINARLLTKCIINKKNNHIIYRFPLALFIKTKERIDPYDKFSVKQLTTAEFILPELTKTMEELLWKK